MSFVSIDVDMMLDKRSERRVFAGGKDLERLHCAGDIECNLSVHHDEELEGIAMNRRDNGAWVGNQLVVA